MHDLLDLATESEANERRKVVVFLALELRLEIPGEVRLRRTHAGGDNGIVTTMREAHRLARESPRALQSSWARDPFVFTLRHFSPVVHRELRTPCGATILPSGPAPRVAAGRARLAPSAEAALAPDGSWNAHCSRDRYGHGYRHGTRRR